MASFSIEHIDSYTPKINIAVLSQSKIVKKRFCRGEQLLEENFIDIASYYSKLRHIILLERGMCCKFKKTEPLNFYSIA